MSNTSYMINVGCGDTPTPGWVNIDASPSVRLARYPVLARAAAPFLNDWQRRYVIFCRAHDIRYGDARKSLPVPDGSATTIYSCHMLEHLDRREARRFLAEARRALANGGTLRIAVPDLAWLAVSYVREGKTADEFMSATHLGRAVPRTIREWASYLLFDRVQHKWMYDEHSLIALVESEGFVEVRRVEPGATRIPNPGALDLWQRADGSLIVEATK